MGEPQNVLSVCEGVNTLLRPKSISLMFIFSSKSKFSAIKRVLFPCFEVLNSYKFKIKTNVFVKCWNSSVVCVCSYVITFDVSVNGSL